MERDIELIKSYFEENEELGKPETITKNDGTEDFLIYTVCCDNEKKYFAEIIGDEKVSVFEPPNYSGIINKVVLPKSLSTMVEGMQKTLKVSVPKIDMSSLYSPSMRSALEYFSEVANEYAENTINITNAITPMLERISESIKAYNQIISENIQGTLEKLSVKLKPLRVLRILSNNQIVVWNRIDSYIVDQITDAKGAAEVDSVMEEYFRCDENYAYNEITNEIESGLNNDYIANIFKQVLFLIENEQYELALVGLFVVTDYLLSNVSGNSTVKIGKRAEEIIEKMEENGDVDSVEYSIMALYFTFSEVSKSICEPRSFKDDEEPELINRHWLLHGRSNRNVSWIDCIKIINYIYAIMIIDTITQKD